MGPETRATSRLVRTAGLSGALLGAVVGSVVSAGVLVAVRPSPPDAVLEAEVDDRIDRRMEAVWRGRLYDAGPYPLDRGEIRLRLETVERALGLPVAAPPPSASGARRPP